MSRNTNNADHGWGPLRRMLQITTGMLTVYAFYHGASAPEHVVDVQNGPSLFLRIMGGTIIAFIPALIFGLTFVRSWK